MWTEDGAGLCTGTFPVKGMSPLRMAVERLPDVGWEWLVWCEDGDVVSGRAGSKRVARCRAEIAAGHMAQDHKALQRAVCQSDRPASLPGWIPALPRPEFSRCSA